MTEIAIGIDLGTLGVRGIAVTRQGILVATARQRLPPLGQDLPPGWHEQAPEDWWSAVVTCLRHLTDALRPGDAVAGVAIDSTSGTVLPVDVQGTPLHPALMYNDTRSRALVPEVRQAAAAHEKRLGLAFDESFALPKILWLARNRPHIAAQTRWFLHAADFIVGRLSGNYGVSDSSNALKTGYDLIEGCWPAFIERDLGIPLARLPRVVPPGTAIGRVHSGGAAESGLPKGTPVLAGATDGTAAQIASGAAEPGAWNSSLGTTLVVKGITEALVVDPEGRVYCHRHPEGWWMPGGASNTGAEWIEKEYPGEDPSELDGRAAGRLPSGIVRYPLVRRGERFPFRRPEAEGFTLGIPADRVEAFAAGLEGVALLERLAYETLAGIGLPVGDRIHVTGGGARSDVWLGVRASALGRTLVRPAIAEPAMGAALLAASGVWFGTLTQAARAMVRIDAIVPPDPVLQGAYGEKYGEFTSELRRRGYLGGGEDHEP